MANSLIASDKGLQLVDEGREKQGWNRSDKRFLQAAGNISRATLNRFYARKPVKHDNFVAICKAVGLEKWQRVAATVLSAEKTQVVAQIPPTTLEELDRELRAWFGALRYEIEKDYLVETEEYFEWIIRIPVRSRFDRVLIHGITGEAGMQDLARVEAVVKERNLDEGCLVTDFRVSRSVAAYLAAEEKGNDLVVCLTFDELIDRDVDFTPYIEWLAGEIERLGIDTDYIQLACSKPEKDSQGKYQIPKGEVTGAEQIDEYMDEWLESAQKNHISVLGEFGTGKTWFAMHYAWVGVRAYLQAKAKRVKRPRLPLLITLRDYAKALNVDTVIAGFFFVNHNIRLNADVFDRLNRMGKLLILFDGFDEMANKINSQDAIDNFWALADVIGENSKVILTCRTEHFPTTDRNQKIFAGGERASTHAKVAAAPKFEILNLHPFSIDQIRQVLTNRGATPESIDLILDNAELYDLVKRPMMADLVLAALPDISAGIITGQRIDLARVYLYALKHKLAQDIKDERTFTSMADKVFFLCEVSWAMLSQNQLTLHYSQFPERLKELFGDAIEDNQLDHWHYDMMCQTILIRDHDGNYRPAHKSLLEFFVAFKFAAELGLLHDDFLDLVREPGEQSLPIAERGYPWADYWRYCRESQGQRGEIDRFEQVEISKLVATFGASPLIPAVMNLLLPMLDLDVSYRQMNPLLELMHWTRAKTLEQAQWVGSNAGSALVKLNPYGLEYQDLSQAVLPDIDLAGAGLREMNLAGANLSGVLTTKTFRGCYAISISLDRKLFFTCHGDGTIRSWTISFQEVFIYYSHLAPVTSIVVIEDWLFSGSEDKTIKQWNISTRKCIKTFTGHLAPVTSIVVIEDWLFSGSKDKTIKQWDISTRKCIKTFTGHQDEVNSIAVIGEWLFSGSSDDTVKQWHITTGGCVQTLRGYQERVNSVIVIGEWVFAGGGDDTVKQWHITTGKCIKSFNEPQDLENFNDQSGLEIPPIKLISCIGSLAVNGTSLFFSTASHIKHWDIITCECIQNFALSQGFVHSLMVSGEWLFGVGGETIRQWNITTGKSVQKLTGYQEWVGETLLVSGRWLFWIANGKTVKKWDIITGECVQIFSGNKDFVRSLTVSQECLFFGNDDSTIEQWDISTGKCVQVFGGHQGSVNSIVVSGEWLFSGSEDNLVRQWDISTGKCVQIFGGHQGGVHSIVMSGEWLFSSSGDRTVKQWNITTGQCIQTFTDYKDSFFPATMFHSVDLVEANEECIFWVSGETVKKWDIVTGQYVQIFAGHRGLVRSLTLSGKWLFSSGDDNTIKKWDIVTGQCVQTFAGHQGSVMSVTVNKEWLFSISRDNTVKKWDILTRKCLATFDNALCAGANITGVRGLTAAQIDSLKALGAVGDAISIQINLLGIN
jgi:WD40 repeat protein